MFLLDSFSGGNPGGGTLFQNQLVFPATKEDLFTRFESDLFAKLISSDSHGNNNAGGYILQASLISRYRNTNIEQVPGLLEYMEESGWDTTNKWRNKNTGNDLCLLTRFVSTEEINRVKAAIRTPDVPVPVPEMVIDRVTAAQLEAIGIPPNEPVPAV